MHAPNDAAVELVAPYCDLAERLELIPPSARARGLYIRNVEKQIERYGKLAAYKRYFPRDSYSMLPWYPAGDYLVRIAVAGALVTSPKDVHTGIYEVARGNATTFAESLLGRAMLRLLARDPVRLSEQGLAGHRQSFTFGHWDLVHHGDRSIEMIYRDEYLWIESLVAGAAYGTFESCGLYPELETKLVDRFNGSTFIRW